VRTFSPKPTDITRAWHVVDADDAVIGRLASEVARILRGKHKPIYAPHVDTGDFVIIVNAGRVRMTSNKAEREFVYRHSGYPGGLRKKSYGELLEKRPEEAVRRAVRGMLPKGTLGRQMLKKLKVYSGPGHPHTAQQPKPLTLPAHVTRAPRKEKKCRSRSARPRVAASRPSPGFAFAREAAPSPSTAVRSTTTSRRPPTA
jgi:large subunit ribosomal protein L13